MELSSFSENIVSVPCKRGDESVDLQVNIDAFTPDFFRDIGKRFESKMKGYKAEESSKKKKTKQDEIAFFEQEARALEISRDIYAELLAGGVLVGWSVTENSIPIQPTVDVLQKLPPRLVEEIWMRCLHAAKTVKKRVDEEIEEASESIASGSREHPTLALAPTG